MLKRFYAVFDARNREFLRDRASLIWSILFPVSIVAVFAFVFSGDSVDLYKVGVYQESSMGDKKKGQDPFFDTEYIQFIPLEVLEEAIVKVERHQLDMVIYPEKKIYWINDTSSRGYILERILSGTTTKPLTRNSVTGSEIRYVDWLLPGVLGMNIMFSALFGVGYVIVRYRKNGVLKRLKGTPLTALEFLSGQMASRLIVIMAITTLVYLSSDLLIDFSMFGSHFDLFVVFTLGAVSLISMGLLVAARTVSEEAAGGLLNIMSLPMMLLSGVWFSLEGSHPLLQTIAQLLPLTHVVDGARAIMIDGAGLGDIVHHLTALLLMTILFLAIGAYSFRWES